MYYVYLIGSGIVAVFWLAFYILRVDLRKKILLSSIIGGVFGFTEVFFVPNYWNPKFKVLKLSDSLFLDSLIFAFFLAGFSSVIYQVVFKKALFVNHTVNTKLFYVPPAIFALHLLLPQINVMVFTFSGMFIGAFLFYLADKRLGKLILFNGLFTFLFFFALYASLWNVFPSLAASYNYKVLSGITAFGVPIEELLFFFAIGTNFCLFYEILGDSRYRKYFTYFYT